MQPAVFLDRDGTLLEELGYLTPSSHLILYPWSIDAVRLLKRAGYAVVVVTNQSGIGRGLYTREFVEATHRMLGERFARGDAPVDAWTYCPHHPEAVLEAYRFACECRKPRAGLVQGAARALDLDLARSWGVGDQCRDVQMARMAGSRGILVRTGHGRTQEASWPADVEPPVAVCDNLMAAVSRILSPQGG